MEVEELFQKYFGETYGGIVPGGAREEVERAARRDFMAGIRLFAGSIVHGAADVPDLKDEPVLCYLGEEKEDSFGITGTLLVEPGFDWKEFVKENKVVFWAYPLLPIYPLGKEFNK